MTQPPLTRGFEVVIGIETHTQLATRSKIFSGASTAFGAAPNCQASAVDLALPGTLPVMNRAAVECAIRFGLAIGAKVAPMSIFARKNYFYPDLPKGYQISQYETPVVQGGAIEFLVGGVPHRVNLTRAHLEEDAGKSIHGEALGAFLAGSDVASHGELTGVDLNRAGTPLLEIVSEPDMRSSVEAAEYAKALHALVVWLGICDGNMQEGSFRCDANVSVRRPGAPYGTRREIKNLNSFRFLQQAIDYEVQWQIDLIEDGGEVRQATVLFDPDRGETRAMRSKEDAHDYRYFPDPDLPPLVIGADWVARVQGELPELPAAMAARFEREYRLPAPDAAALTSSRASAAYFESALAALQAQPTSAAPDAQAAAKLVANWMMGELARRLNAAGSSIDAAPVGPVVLGALLARLRDRAISANGAKQAFDELWGAPPEGDAATAVDAIVAARGLAQMSDTGELERVVEGVVAANPKLVDEVRGGKEKAFNALVGQTMKATRGQADPAQVNQLLRKKIG
ncbi:Asp-tRNA(Asn)/Glu-tRNA(Gln) amidotransferase subunit GatB [Piscinibacter koreensis]|uniref:Aspartyl/glutamyl-tRNA(Asn/Gln) amidotransferase subunit B n=1 Tax=Piscinibacter koreensis TaxID=2742824 RepID=A0A7Y6NJP3_9BURK|nr:Asp-tRNA(Asn)/Glu-tRNA(Gln) amidotransferase subunit GatB [Schlegelella koreensis]NUZ04438.1 Asp-tRNA(Asn)/Glu-tRNA(Gln) amidotransferase subunit GatB [Schlegelella koreensis]